MPRNAALAGRMVNGVWCAPATAEVIARVSDFWKSDCVFVRDERDEDEMWSAMIDWFPPVTLMEEQVTRTLHRTKEGKLFVWSRHLAITTTGAKIERDEITLMSREQAWHWAQAEGVILLVQSFDRFPSKKRR